MSAQPTDEVFFSSAGRDFTPNQHNFTGCETLWFVPFSRYRAGAINVYVHSQSASEKTTPQSASLTAPLTQRRQGKCGAKSAPQYREAAVLRFCRQFRYRASAIPVSVQCPCASKKSVLAEPVGLCFQISAASPHTLIIHYSLFTIHLQAMPALPGCRNKCIRKGSVRQ